MALSVFLRSASSKLNGCPTRLLSQQLLRCHTPLSGFSTFRMISAVQPAASSSLLQNYQIQTIIPKSNYASPTAAAPKENKVSLWIAERIVAASLIVTIPLAIAIPNKILDVIVAITIIAHTYWGFEALVQEYLRPILVGNLVPKVAHILVILLMMLSLGGLFYLIFDDIGIGGTVRKFWSMKSKNE